jgi:hypothetical protein
MRVLRSTLTRSRLVLWDQDGLALPDQLMAAYGPAMEVYGRYAQVLRPDGSTPALELRLRLTGPAGLGMLDEVTVVILDESGTDHWAHGLPDGLGEKDALRFVWGPWEFNTGASAQVTDNRTTRPAVVLPGRWPELGPPQPGAHPARVLDEHEPGAVAEAARGPDPAADQLPAQRRAVGSCCVKFSPERDHAAHFADPWSAQHAGCWPCNTLFVVLGQLHQRAVTM